MAFKNHASKDALSELKQQLKSKSPARIYLFYGNEPFLIDYYIDELKKLILKADHQGFNFTLFENKVDMDALMDACDTFPVLADKKLVLVRNSGLFASKGKKDESDDGEQAPETGNRAQEALKKYIPDIPETTCLVFYENSVDKRLGTYKQTVKSGLAAELDRPGPKELVRWVIKGFKTMDKFISQEASEYLVAMSEPDMYSIKNEMLKLDAYTGERKEITVGDVKLVATPTIKSVIFDLLDAVAQKNAPKSLHILEDILELKEPEQKILAMLSKQTGEILKLKYLVKNGANQSQITGYFQGKHPYALKMMMNQARDMDEKYLKKFLKNCMEAEMSYKSGLMAPKLALEVLLSKINS